MGDKQVAKIMQLMVQLRHVMHQQNKQCKDGISFTQLAVLYFIMDRKAVPMKDIAKELAITPPSATVFVETLFKEGLIARHSEEKDRRAVMLKLTRKGTQFLKDNFKRMTEQIEQVMERLDQEEQKMFAQILEKIIKSYQRP